MVANYLSSGLAAATTAWMPDRWWGWGFGLAGGYLGKECAIAYTPWMVGQTVLFLGKFVGTDAIAPLIRQRMFTLIVPVTASIMAFTGFYTAVVITNIMFRTFSSFFPKTSPNPP